MNECSFIFVALMRGRDQNKTDAIKNVAIQMIAEHGFDGISMQKIAKAANVSPATIYIYFKDKEALIETIAIEEMDKMTQITLKDFHASMEFAVGLRKQWENRMNYWLEYPLSARFTEQVRNSPIGMKVKQKVKVEFANIMREFVKNAVNKGDLRPMQAEIYWSLAFAPLYQLIKFQLDGKGLRGEEFKLNDTIINETFKCVLKSLKP